MLHRLATAQASLDQASLDQASLDNDMRPALLSGAVLLGPARPDLIRDELLCEIFAATVAAIPPPSP